MLSRWKTMSTLTLVAGLMGADDKGRLKLVESVPRDDLVAVTGVAISPDGKYLYSASWQAATLSTFARDAKTGKLEHKQTLSSPELLAGSTSVTVSPDGRFALAVA